MGFGVRGFGFRVLGSGVSGFGFRVSDSGFGVWDLGLMVWGLNSCFEVLSLQFGVLCFVRTVVFSTYGSSDWFSGFWVLVSGFRCSIACTVPFVQC